MGWGLPWGVAEASTELSLRVRLPLQSAQRHRGSPEDLLADICRVSIYLTVGRKRRRRMASLEACRGGHHARSCCAGRRMAKKKITRDRGDIREHPRYSVIEAASDLGISPSTLYSWILPKGNKAALIQLADTENTLLSFYNLVEVYVLLSTRRRGLPMSKVRTAVEYMNEKIGGKHPLATYRFATSGKGMFVRHLEGKTVDASRYGQPAIGDMLDKYLKGIKRGHGDKMPIEIRPLKAKTLKQSPVVINPYISSGSPIIKGTGIIASTLWKRAKGGEALDDLASDYDLKLSEVQKVIDYLDAVA